MVTARIDGKYITRNISQFKMIDPSLKDPDQEEDDEDLNADDIVIAPSNPPVQQRLNPAVQQRLNPPVQQRLNPPAQTRPSQ